jgi:hypothetical protein
VRILASATNKPDHLDVTESLENDTTTQSKYLINQSIKFKDLFSFQSSNFVLQDFFL